MFHTIECSQINLEDTTFLMSYPIESERIIRSVGAVGVMQPIIVTGCSCEDGYQVVVGFKRAYACRKIGIKMVNAYIYQVDPQYRRGAFSLAFHENASHRTFNTVERSLILTKLLDQLQCPREELLRSYMPLLGLASSEKALDIYLRLWNVPEEIKRYLAEHDLSMTVLEWLVNLSADDRMAVFSLISTVKFGVNTLKEVLTELDEIALRENCSIRQILAEQEIQEILTHAKYPGPQKTDHVRRFLRQRRYPQLTTLEQEYHDRLRQLQLPRGVQMTTDRFFEDDDVTVTFRIHSPEQLKTLSETLLRLAEQPELQSLLDLIQGREK